MTATKTDSFKIPSVEPRRQHEKKRSLLLITSLWECSENEKRAPDEWIKEIGDLNKTFAK